MKTAKEARQITRDVINKREQLALEKKALDKQEITLNFRNFELQMKDFIEDVFNEIEIRANNGLGYAYYMYEIPNPSKKDNEDIEEFIKVCTAYFESLGFIVFLMDIILLMNFITIDAYYFLLFVIKTI